MFFIFVCSVGVSVVAGVQFPPNEKLYTRVQHVAVIIIVEFFPTSPALLLISLSSLLLAPFTMHI